MFIRRKVSVTSLTSGSAGRLRLNSFTALSYQKLQCAKYSTVFKTHALHVHSVSSLLGKYRDSRLRLSSPSRQSCHNYSTITNEQTGRSNTENRLTLDHNLRISLEQLIFKFATKPVPTITLSDLLKFNSSSDHHNKDKMLIDNANDTMADMLVLVLRRINEFMKLPYIVMLNPNIAEIFNTYLLTLKLLIDFVNKVNPELSTEDLDSFKIETLDQNDIFIDVLQKTIDIHTDNLTILSEGFEEVSSLAIVDDKLFLNDHLKERILMRLLTNHHIALSNQLTQTYSFDLKYNDLNQIGIIQKNVDVLEVLKRSETFVNDMCSLKYDEKIRINVEVVTIHSDETKTVKYFKDGESFGDLKVIFPCISSHLEYVLNEVFKNSARAHIENKVHEPVEVVLVINEPSDELSGPQIYDLEIKVSDKGKGIPPDIINNLFDYSFTTFNENFNEEEDSYKTLNNTGGNSANIIAGMGYGLPLSKIYVELFDGYIDIQSIHTYGTDVILKWKGPDKKLFS